MLVHWIYMYIWIKWEKRVTLGIEIHFATTRPVDITSSSPSHVIYDLSHRCLEKMYIMWTDISTGTSDNTASAHSTSMSEQNASRVSHQLANHHCMYCSKAPDCLIRRVERSGSMSDPTCCVLLPRASELATRKINRKKKKTNK